MRRTSDEEFRRVVKKTARQAKGIPDDPKPWEELFLLVWDRIYRIALCVTHDHGLAEDAAQEGFFAAWREISRWDDRRPFLPWIGTIVYRKALDLLRSRRRVVAVDIEEQHGATIIPLLLADPNAPLRLVEDREVIRGILEELPRHHRDALALRYFGELTSDEIGELLGVPGSTVRGWFRTIEQRWAQQHQQRPQAED